MSNHSTTIKIISSIRINNMVVWVYNIGQDRTGKVYKDCSCSTNTIIRLVRIRSWLLDTTLLAINVHTRDSYTCMYVCMAIFRTAIYVRHKYIPDQSSSVHTMPITRHLNKVSLYAPRPYKALAHEQAIAISAEHEQLLISINSSACVHEHRNITFGASTLFETAISSGC